MTTYTRQDWNAVEEYARDAGARGDLNTLIDDTLAEYEQACAEAGVEPDYDYPTLCRLSDRVAAVASVSDFGPLSTIRARAQEARRVTPIF